MSVSKRSLVQFILLQIAIAAFGIWVVSGVVQQYLLKQALINAFQSNAEDIQNQLTEFKSSFPKSSKQDLDGLMNDFCESVLCSVESIDLSTSNEGVLTIEELRMVAVAQPEDVPIILEVFHRLPQRWLVVGLEVQGYEQPLRFQVRLQRHLVQVDHVEWHPIIQSLLLTELDEVQINTLLEWQAYKHYFEEELEQVRQNSQDWGRLYQSLNKPLWTLRTHPGKIIYTPVDGVRLQSLTEAMK